MTNPNPEVDRKADANRDPLSGALAGTMAAAPVGTVIGAGVGAVAGGLAGKGIAMAIDPTLDESYWRKTHSSRPYVKGGATFDDYGPAYSYGVDSYERSPAIPTEMKGKRR